MEELDFNNMKLDDSDKRFFEEIAKANSIGKTLRCISHAVNGYLHNVLLAVGNLEDGIPDTPEKQKEAFRKIVRNSLKASLATNELRKFYHL